VLHLTFRSAAAVEAVRPGPVTPGVYWVDGGPVLRALDPEEYERRQRFGAEPDQPDASDARRQREAILPDPPTGRELVDRVRVEMQEQPTPVPATTAARPHRVSQRHWLAPNFVLPVPRGT
jgi:hypothetical protein